MMVTQVNHEVNPYTKLSGCSVLQLITKLIEINIHT